MGANSTGQTPNQRLNDQVSSLLDNARRQLSLPSLRLEDASNVNVQNLLNGQGLFYDQASGTWINDNGGGASYVFDFPGLFSSYNADPVRTFSPAASITIKAMATVSGAPTATSGSVFTVIIAGSNIGTLTIPQGQTVVGPLSFVTSIGATDLITAQSTIPGGASGGIVQIKA